jgi:hypothetical protein
LAPQWNMTWWNTMKYNEPMNDKIWNTKYNI